MLGLCFPSPGDDGSRVVLWFPAPNFSRRLGRQSGVLKRETEIARNNYVVLFYPFAGESMMSLEGMRDLLKGSLARSLGALSDQDRLAAAWPVACGKTLAGRGTVVGYADGIVRVQVEDGAWLRQLTSMRGQLAGELARIAGVTVSEIHFEGKRKDRG